MNLDFRTEMFNPFNYPILGLPNTSLSRIAIATSQTRITGTAANTFPRIIQFAMKAALVKSLPGTLLAIRKSSCASVAIT